MAFEDNALSIRIGFYKRLQIQTELKARSPPRQPSDFIAKNFLGQAARVFRRCNCNDCIRVHMIHMAKRYKSMQWRINRSRSRVEIKGAMRKETNHTVFIFNTFIDG